MPQPPASPSDWQQNPESRSFIDDFRESVSGVVNHSELLWQLTLRDIRLRYKQSVMGFAWAILMPLLIVFAGIVVRSAMALATGVPIQPDAIGSIAVKALPWAFFAGAVGFASGTLVGNASLVSKVYFPQEVLPLAAVLTQAFEAIIAAVALSLALPFLGAKLSFALFWVIPLSLLLLMLTSGLCLILACANLFYRDVKYLVQVLLTFGIFFTPVLFDASMLGDHWGRLMMLNPIAPVLEGFRLAVISGHNLLEPLQLTRDGRLVELWLPSSLLWVACCALIGTLVAASLFRRFQYLFAENL